MITTQKREEGFEVCFRTGLECHPKRLRRLAVEGKRGLDGAPFGSPRCVSGIEGRASARPFGRYEMSTVQSSTTSPSSHSSTRRVPPPEGNTMPFVATPEIW
jgi:hypothetical protein